MPDARTIILQKIKTALQKNTPQPFNHLPALSEAYIPNSHPLDVLFAQAFLNVNGQFIYCENEEEFLYSFLDLVEANAWQHVYCWEQSLQDLFREIDFRKCRIGRNLERAHAGLTFCDALIARTGSIVLSSGLACGRSLSVFPPVHLVVAYTSQLVYTIADAFTLLQQKYGTNLPSMITLATGPSRTADIEKTLVLGAHGPKAVYLFLIDDLLAYEMEQAAAQKQAYAAAHQTAQESNPRRPLPDEEWQREE
jgi:L-lactate dehydrogenase complex protein LldG